MIRVLVADDQQLMRTALAHFVSTAEDLEVVGTAADGVEAVEMAKDLRPDVVLMDMQMPRMDGIEATTAIMAEAPEVRVLAITTFSSEAYLVPALRAGASGYLVKDAPPEEVVEAVRQVHRGDAVFSPRVARELIETVTQQSERRESAAAHALTELEELTPRELEVVTELAKGSSNAEIAQALFLAEATVKSHLGKIMDKWQARDRVQVLIRASRAGLVSFDD
ncbi:MULTISPECIES: response regulator transcription factor [Micrococcus]|jgi:DNA-binding NarL/FixJ family response regulator|uniref:DNA-binding NarL/FixJ family response regulator n=2 Tax=Micrococcus TaxID=1269 RepID=A0A4Y8ZFI7_9MICC|nr:MULTISPECIES: response regulator transcription factor [Micrococcus]ACS31653.1 response regulator containing a CheY-like receiver domain and an HTH DNA-binding domain [Micrococcus luteus NCTC 2665]AJO56704.1 LuxR family transcriptional regulator [Micrococcus luteus]KAB1900737.1 response regulator transcription factor [Micrococcus luteus NCTC 2665]MBB5849566.1 DNA-binding NarL/FixJ family response regulator [Micrococcus endophyticus]MCR8675556.1 response regulator transcription factor [Microc